MFYAQPQGLSEQLGRTRSPAGSPGGSLSPGPRAALLEAHGVLICSGSAPDSVLLLMLPWALVTWTPSGPHPWDMALVLLGLSHLTYKVYMMVSPASQGCWENPFGPEAEK